MKLYAIIDGKKQGPFTPSEIADKLRSGELEANALAWRSGLSEWQPLGEVCPDLPEAPTRQGEDQGEDSSGLGSGSKSRPGTTEPEEEKEAGLDEDDLLRPDSLFGQYRIIRLLGRGGMGEVYAVEHETLGTRHALKLINRDVMEQTGALERFRKEGRAMAGLSHPGIVKVDLADETDGRHWLRMEWMSSMTKSGWCQSISE